nr:unnamed protein product [Callosobruchus analis]
MQTNVRLVLAHLSHYNVKVNIEKCKLFEQQVEYLGHKINKDGVHPTVENLCAIREAPEPKYIT